MSLEATIAVWNHSLADGNQKLLLLAIADCINFPEASGEISREYLRDLLHWSEGQLVLNEYILLAIDELALLPGSEAGFTTYTIPQLPGEPDRMEEEQQKIARWKANYEKRREERREERERKKAAKANANEPLQAMVRMSDLKKLPPARRPSRNTDGHV